MHRDLAIRGMDTGLKFASKENLLRCLGEFQFCFERGKLWLDGFQIIHR